MDYRFVRTWCPDGRSLFALVERTKGKRLGVCVRWADEQWHFVDTYRNANKGEGLGSYSDGSFWMMLPEADRRIRRYSASGEQLEEIRWEAPADPGLFNDVEPIVTENQLHTAHLGRCVRYRLEGESTGYEICRVDGDSAHVIPFPTGMELHRISLDWSGGLWYSGNLAKSSPWRPRSDSSDAKDSSARRCLWSVRDPRLVEIKGTKDNYRSTVAVSQRGYAYMGGVDHNWIIAIRPEELKKAEASYYPLYEDLYDPAVFSALGWEEEQIPTARPRYSRGVAYLPNRNAVIHLEGMIVELDGIAVVRKRTVLDSLGAWGYWHRVVGDRLYGMSDENVVVWLPLDDFHDGACTSRELPPIPSEVLDMPPIKIPKDRKRVVTFQIPS